MIELPCENFIFKQPIKWDSNLLISIQRNLMFIGYFAELYDIYPIADPFGGCCMATVEYYIKLPKGKYLLGEDYD